MCFGSGEDKEGKGIHSDHEEAQQWPTQMHKTQVGAWMLNCPFPLERQLLRIYCKSFPLALQRRDLRPKVIKWAAQFRACSCSFGPSVQSPDCAPSAWDTWALSLAPHCARLPTQIRSFVMSQKAYFSFFLSPFLPKDPETNCYVCQLAPRAFGQCGGQAMLHHCYHPIFKQRWAGY